MTHSGTHDPTLVIMSLIVAVFASYTALDLSARVQASSGAAKRAWLVAAATALGGGIWTMHFLAMLAHGVPGAGVSYDPGMTAASLGIAILMTGAGFVIVGLAGAPRQRLAVAGIAMGLGIVAMHYLGMAAMRISAALSFDRLWVAVSVVIAVVAATSALWLASRKSRTTEQLAAAGLMGLAIAGMHFSGMRAVTFAVQHERSAFDTGVGQLQLALGVFATAFVVLLLSLVAAMFDRRFGVLAEREAAALRQSEERFRSLYRGTPLPLFSLNSDGIITQVSDAWLASLGYRREDVIGRPLADYLDPASAQRLCTDWPQLLSADVLEAQEYRCITKAGAILDVLAALRVERSKDGALLHVLGGLTDVTKQRCAELALRRAGADLAEANRMLLMAEEMSGVGHWRVDLTSGTVFWSDTVCDIHGHARGYEPRMETALAAYHEDDRATVERVVNEALTNGTPYEFRARLRRLDGALRHVVARGRPERNGAGEVIALFGVFQDVTDAQVAELALKAASQELRDSNRMLTMAEAVARLGHWRVDSLGGQQFWSDEVYRIHGMGRNEPPSFEGALAQYHPEDRERVRQLVQRAYATRESYGFKARIFRPDGGMVHILVRGEVDVTASGEVIGLFGIVQDITEQAAVEALLREREERFRLITEEASDMISLNHVDGRCIFMSPASTTVLGYDPDEMLDLTPYAFLPEADHATFREHARRVIAAGVGGVTTVRVRMNHADGGTRWMEVASRMSPHDGEVQIISVSRDVSAQVATEIALEEARAAAEAAALAKSTFLANMSHEIRTPMNGVIGFTDLLLGGELSTEQRRQIELIADSGRAMMRLLNDILDFSKVEAGQMKLAEEPFDLSQALGACVTLVAPAAERKGLDLRLNLDPDLPAAILGDGLRVRQIVLNLLGNATKFTDAGSITVSGRSDRGRVLIEVVDTGIGIAPDRHGAIFEQFVQADSTTAAKYGGTGLGLAISSRLAKLMGGELSLSSELAVGTRFLLTLPLKLETSAQPRAATDDVDAPSATPAPSDRSRILVAEDHDVNQLLITAMLGRLGYSCELAPNGRRAVEMARAASEVGAPYSLVLMDMQMPEMGGLEATRCLRADGFAAQSLPIVALSANAFEDDIRACLDAGMQDHLAKPFTIEGLQAVLERWARATPPILPKVTQSASRFSPKLHARYKARKEEAMAMLDDVVRRGSFAESELQTLADCMHKLAGTAEMFGEGALGNAARDLEEGIAEWAEPVRPALVRASIDAIRRAA